MNSDNLRKIIFILDDDPGILKLCDVYLRRSKIPCDIYIFNNYKEMINHPCIDNASLIIIDIFLDGITGPQVCEIILDKSCSLTTFLFISGKDFEYDDFSNLCCTYDFIKKPFTKIEFTNRCKLLINISDRLSDLSQVKRKIEIGLWDVFNYSNIYLLILDPEMNIRLCSYMLAIDLGYESEDEIIGENWLDFLPDNMKTNITHIHNHIIKNPTSKEKRFQEVTNDIITIKKKIITVRWFNACINNGVKLTFSIGIPLTKDITKNDNIETLRAYWAEKINKDRTTIDAFRGLMYSQLK